MKVVHVGLSALFASSYAQQASQPSDLSQIKWTEISPEGTKDDDGNVVTQSDPENLFVSIQTQSEMDAEDAEITEYRKKYDGIYDPNMYPYGPKHQDTRVPNADDAVSDPITLPTPFPLFGGASTDTLRCSTNGVCALSDAAIASDAPQPFDSNDIDSNFVAGFWSDIWSKKHGRMYMRIEQSNTTLLEEIRTDLEDGLPQFGPNPLDGIINDLQYAFIFSYWRVTHYGAIKSDDQLQNTFQIVLTTDGTHSFLILNYQDVQWGQRNNGANFATAGYDVEFFNSGNLPIGTGTAGVLEWETTSTNANLGGRHIFQLDDNPIQAHPTIVTPPSPCEGNQCQNGAVCQEDGDSYTCDCASGFKGNFCAEIDACAGNNGGCQNGASCNSVNGQASCTCAVGFTGNNCETVDNPCEGVTCSDGEVCAAGNCVVAGNIFENEWPANENCQEENPAGCLAGAIGSYTPPANLGNGTCFVTFPEEPAFFHIFDAHIRADNPTVPNQWAVCAANEHFEPGHDGSFRYLVYFASGSSFSADDVAWTCDPADTYEYAVYSFPQRYLESNGRTNIRHLSSHEGNNFDDQVLISMGAQVANFTVDDQRVTVETADNQNFILSAIPDTFEELWFQWDYLPGQFFLSNTVGVFAE